MLPTALATTSGVSLLTVDIRPISSTATASATGEATVLLPPVDSGYLWLVDALSVRTTSTSGTRAEVWAGTRLMDGSDSGNFDFSDRSSAILVDSTEQLQITWIGATPGATCTVDGQYRLISRQVS